MPWRTEDCLQGGAQFKKWNPAKWVDANMAACHAALRIIEHLRGLKFPDTLIQNIATHVELPLMPGSLSANESGGPWDSYIPFVILLVHTDAHQPLKEALEKRTFADGVRVLVQSTSTREATIDLARDLAADLPVAIGSYVVK